MNHFGVAAAGVHADARFRLQYRDLAPGERERTRHREPYHAGADHYRIESLHIR
jgi:hypothetical protein